MNGYVETILELAKKSYDNDEVPVGAIVVRNNQIIGKGFNDRENSHLITGHAEINAINDACLHNKDWRLDDCVMYVTLYPCAMCAGAIVDSRICKVYYLLDRTNVYNNNADFECEKILSPNYYDEYVKLLKLFFENKRK